MLIFVVGGVFQGKYEFARTFDLPVVNNLQDIIKELMEHEEDVTQKVIKMLDKESCVAVLNEIGCGIVPEKKKDRDYRELVGRIGCEIARKADAVYRVEAGIAHKIKG